MGLLETIRGRAEERATTRKELRQRLLREDCERVLRHESLSPEQADEMLARHDEYGIEPEDFVAAVEAMRAVSALEELIEPREQFDAETLKLHEKLSELREEQERLEMRLPRVKGELVGTADRLRQRSIIRQAQLEDLANKKAALERMLAGEAVEAPEPKPVPRLRSVGEIAARYDAVNPTPGI